MKKHFFALGAFVAISTIGISTAQAGVGVSVSIGQPGFYGQLDIGDYYPRPQVLYADPRVIYVEPAYRYAQPIYLRVPPGHAKRWSNYCGRYNACGRPVYFVQDTWYQTFMPPDIKSIASAVMMDDAMIAITGVETMAETNIMTDIMTVQTMTEVIGTTQVTDQTDIKVTALARADMTAAVMTEVVKTKAETAEVMAAAKWI